MRGGNGVIAIEDIKQLKNKYGQSFYLVNDKEFHRHYNLWEHAFASIYKNTRLAYSYKTNYLPILCKTNKNIGGLAEVVSEIEYKIASTIGVPDGDIIYNGPMKSTEISADIVLADGIVNVDSLVEAESLVYEIRRRTSKPVKIGIRCNLSCNDRISRFGIATDSEEFKNTIQLFKENKIQVGCLHCHVKGRGIDVWRKKTEMMLAVFDSILEYCSTDCSIDLGGSLPALIDCEEAKNIASCYAESVAGPFRDRNQRTCPHLILEPGTALAAPTMTFITTAIAHKRINNQSYITLSASCQNLGSRHNRDPKYLRQYPLRECSQTAILCGYTCLEDDIICNYDRRVEVDDTFVFPNVGAYSVVMKPPFIMPNFPIITYNEEKGIYDLVRASEDIHKFCAEYELKG